MNRDPICGSRPKGGQIRYVRDQVAKDQVAKTPRTSPFGAACSAIS
jgi:hypothetical protein